MAEGAGSGQEESEEEVSWGWSNHTPRTAQDVAKAFYAGKKCKRGNCETDGREYKLFGNVIARRVPEEDVPSVIAARLNGERTRRLLEYTWAGWPSPTTARHLNALGVRASRYGGTARFNDRPCNDCTWYTPEEIEALPPEPPKKPRTKFVNLTAELFA